ncbi:hypothetical protein PLUTE_a3535 [Pseudoalteromonas luteoviolacea DSM 6061]|nr:hypothetical protein [Pseudoalteromonas luteoviolacea DSM 6061]
MFKNRTTLKFSFDSTLSFFVNVAFISLSNKLAHSIRLHTQ